ncbi:alpha-1,2-fucosyltransferase [soil metagenome]
MGGLGNQMFQFAAARSLSIKRKINFKIDFDDPYKYVKREFGLSAFKLETTKASQKELSKCKPKVRYEKQLWLLLGRNPLNRIYKEKRNYIFESGFFLCPDESYVSGFWQTEKYFTDIEDIIRADFQFRSLPFGRNLEWLTIIRSFNAVSVHIRRGDYVSVPKTNQAHGLCSLNYYEKAFAHIASFVQSPVFFFFSDDMDWVKANIIISSPAYYVEGNDDAHNYEDLRLMSSCKHHIIANSSFSWWGAWLNPDKTKMVIAPKKWTAAEDIGNTDHIPSSWILL